jgi:integrase
MAEARLQAILEGDDPLVSVETQRDVVTFETAVDEWLADRGGECRPSTMHDYRSTARTRLRPFFGDDTPVTEVTTERVNEMRATMAADGLSGRTINKTLALAHGVFKLAQELHALPGNPVATARRAKQRRRKLEQYLTAPEVLTLAAHAETPRTPRCTSWPRGRACAGASYGRCGSATSTSRAATSTSTATGRATGIEDVPKSGKPRAVPMWDQAARVLDVLSRREHFTSDTTSCS